MPKKMTRERWMELMQPFAENDGINLTPEEVEEGWHWCAEWDDLLIHVDDDEFECCGCSWMERFRTPERMKAMEERMEKRYASQEALDKIAELDEELGLNDEPDRENNSFRAAD